MDLDTTAPVVQIMSPTANATFAPGDQIQLRAEVTDNIGLEMIRVLVTDASGTERVVDDEDVRDFLNDNREADLDFMINLDQNAQPGAYQITVEATDEQGNTGERTVNVNVAM